VPRKPTIPPAVKTDSTALIEQFARAGYSIFQGTVAGKQATVVFTPYSEERMKQRDVLVEEALEILRLPPSAHGPGTQARRREVVGPVGKRQVRVVYEWIAKQIAKVITVFQD
jgi:hypothetical protein